MLLKALGTFFGGGFNFYPRSIIPVDHLKAGLPPWDLGALGGVVAGYGAPGNRLNAIMLQILIACSRLRDSRVR